MTLPDGGGAAQRTALASTAAGLAQGVGQCTGDLGPAVLGAQSGVGSVSGGGAGAPARPGPSPPPLPGSPRRSKAPLPHGDALLPVAFLAASGALCWSRLLPAHVLAPLLLPLFVVGVQLFVVKGKGVFLC